MPLGDALKKAAGIFIDTGSENAEEEWNVMTAKEPAAQATPAPKPAVKTVEQIVRDSPGPNLDEIKAPATQAQPVIGDDGRVNYAAIYGLAGLPTASFSAEQVLEILSSLPAGLPIETQRATLKVTLDAMGKTLGVTPESVVADASRKLAALASYAQSYGTYVTQVTAESEAEIAKLEAQIQALKDKIADGAKKQETVVASCKTEADRLSTVLQFFSQTPKV
jgi:hypothetical protein